MRQEWRDKKTGKQKLPMKTKSGKIKENWKNKKTKTTGNQNTALRRKRNTQKKKKVDW